MDHTQTTEDQIPDTVMSTWHIIKSSAWFAVTRYDLVLFWLGLVVLTGLLAGVLTAFAPSTVGISAVVSTALAIGGIGYFLLLLFGIGVIEYSVTHRDAAVTVGAAVRYMAAHYRPWVGLQLLSFCLLAPFTVGMQVAVLAYMYVVSQLVSSSYSVGLWFSLLTPLGAILMTIFLIMGYLFLYLARIRFLQTGSGVIDAFAYAAVLLKKNWWFISSRFVLANVLLVLVLVILMALPLVVLEQLSLSQTALTTAVVIYTTIISVGMGILGYLYQVRVLSLLQQRVEQSVRDQTVHDGYRTGIIIWSWIGGALFVFVVVALIVSSFFLRSFESGMSQTKAQAEAQNLKSEVDNVALQIEFASFDRPDLSYAGLCDQVLTSGQFLDDDLVDVITCVATPDTFHVYAALPDGAYYCTDNRSSDLVLETEPVDSCTPEETAPAQELDQPTRVDFGRSEQVNATTSRFIDEQRYGFAFAYPQNDTTVASLYATGDDLSVYQGPTDTNGYAIEFKAPMRDHSTATSLEAYVDENTTVLQSAYGIDQIDEQTVQINGIDMIEVLYEHPLYSEDLSVLYAYNPSSDTLFYINWSNDGQDATEQLVDQVRATFSLLPIESPAE